jgi:hypothetical protein
VFALRHTQEYAVMADRSQQLQLAKAMWALRL